MEGVGIFLREGRPLPDPLHSDRGGIDGIGLRGREVLMTNLRFMPGIVVMEPSRPVRAENVRFPESERNLIRRRSGLE
ncbi:hypothetical protein CUJ86_05140 [Methanofollis fontis]|uniref:Uncharacterized protein n=1 Tax=Methanofollis fontis TaxID=2052832 RepID=A0A483CTR4_9EURY|nr:hypothetical protein CUJ86_05140 [Methanofollis fontis]